MTQPLAMRMIRNRSSDRAEPLSRRGFLIVDLLAGVALAGLALALVAMVIKSDIQVRRAREARYRCLIRFENALARAETLGFSALDQTALRGILGELARIEGDDSKPPEVVVSELPGPPAGKRVVLRSAGEASAAGAVFMMRDFYPGTTGGGSRP